MKLHFIYVMLGIVTLVLNIVLTVHLFRSHSSPQSKEILGGNDLITFRLTREHKGDEATTAAVPYDDTVLMGEDA